MMKVTRYGCKAADVPIIIPIICQGVCGRCPYSLKWTENKISEYGLYITETVYREVSCGTVVGWVLMDTWTGVWILQLQARVSCRVSGTKIELDTPHPKKEVVSSKLDL